MITLENLTLSNPGEVLAVCGLFVLATRQDRKATLAWTNNGAVIDTEQTLDELLLPLLDAQISSEAGNKSEPASIQIGSLTLNWWYYRTKNNKLWAGRVTASSLVETMLTACKKTEPMKFIELKQSCSQTTGLDSLLAWTPINLGWSPNTQKDGGVKIHMPARPWIELLSLIGIQGFTSQLFASQKGASARWHYFLWKTPLRLLPARFTFSGQLTHGKQDLTCGTWCYQANILNKSEYFRVLSFAERL